jgi:hypothetical protein
MKKRVAALAVFAAVAVAAVFAVTAFASSSKAGSGQFVSASPQGVSPAAGALGGWQSDFVYAVPAGIGGVFFHYPCPGTKIANDGKFAVDFSDPSASTVHLLGQGIRTDVPGGHEYFWNISWQPGSAPSGSHITFNVHCGRS